MKKLVAVLAVGLAAATLSSCASVPSYEKAVSGHGALADPAHAQGVNARLDATAAQNKAIELLRSASSLRIKGSVEFNATSIEMDIHYGRKSSSGYISVEGVGLNFRAVGGKVWVQGDDAFWTKSLAGYRPPGVSMSKIMRTVHGKWLRVGSGGASGAAGTDDLRELASRAWTQHLIVASSAPATRGPNDLIHGVPAVSFVMGDSDHSRIYVPASGAPYPLRVEADGHGSLDFSHWNKPYSATKPPVKAILNLPGH